MTINDHFADYVFDALPQHVNTWLILAKGLHLRAAPFDVRLFPMKRTAHVAQVAMTLIRRGVVEVSSLVTNHIEFGDQAAVVRAFAHYGEGGSMKFSLLTEHARAKPPPSLAVPEVLAADGGDPGGIPSVHEIAL